MKKFLILFLFFCLGATALADHRITMRTTMAESGMEGFKMTQVTLTKGKRQRVEDVTEVAGHKIVQVRLVMCDTEQEASLDPEAKIYTVRSLLPGNLEGVTEDRELKEGTGTIKTHVKVTDKGAEKVAGHDAHHWLLDTDMSGSGCIGEFAYSSQREIWTADLPTFNCPILSGQWAESTFDGCKVKNEVTGDVDLFNQAMSRQVVKEIFFQDGKKIMTRELVEYSTAELDSTLFSLEGYRKVTQAEFDKASQERMMRMYSN